MGFSKNNRFKIILTVVLTVLLVSTTLPYAKMGGFLTKAETGAVPAHSKTQTDNYDGTYQLELSVTGDAETTKTASNVNVLVVYDVSSSMTHNWLLDSAGWVGSVASSRWNSGSTISNGYTTNDNTMFRLYKLNGNNYEQIAEGTRYAGTAYYRTTASDYSGTQYGRTNDSSPVYFPIYYRNGRWRTADAEHGSHYDGTRYKFTAYSGDRYTVRRAEAGEKAVYDLTEALFQHQDSSNPNNIQMALVTFCGGTSSETKQIQGWTSTKTNITNKLSQTGAYKSQKLNYGSGTNYEKALQLALDPTLKAADGDPTYVIFVTDGQPSQSVTTGNTTDNNTRLKYYQDSRDEAIKIENYNTATHNSTSGSNNTYLYGIYAFGKEDDFLDDLIYYAHNNKDRPDAEGGVTKATVETPYYYNAGDATALSAAISDIFSDIVKTLGVESVSINDGTTSQVKTTSGSISELLEIDETSYKYWLTIPVANQKFNKTDTLTGDNVEYTVADNSNGTITLSWGTDQSVTVPGTLSLNTLKIQWTNDAALDAFYSKNPPAAKLEDGAVKWDLSSVGTLLDDVTYSVTFDVYPSQETYDYIAQLRNGTIKYEDLDENIKKYLKGDNTSGYTLATNTEATLSYNDTRNKEGTKTVTYDNPQPVTTTASQLTVTKFWDPIGEAQDITMTVTKDGENFFDVNLTSANNYTASAYISTGLMRVTYNAETITGVTVLDEGHDYTFSEMDDNSYYWDLDVQTVRPMLINSASQISNLVLVKDASQAASLSTAMGSNIYLQKDGKTYFKIQNKIYELSSSAETGNLSASNTKRSHLFLYKNVTGDDPGGADFPFGLTVNAAFNTHVVDVTPGDQANTYSYINKDGVSVTVEKDSVHEDLYIAKYTSKGSTVVLYGNIADGKFTYQEALWFSMWDYATSKSVTGLTPAGWTEEENSDGTKTGYYYAPNRTALNISMTKNNNIRFGNVPVGTTYTFIEAPAGTSMPKNYSYEKAEATPNGGITTDDEKKVTGTVTESNKNFAVTFTNHYEKTQITASKKWNGTKGTSATVQLYQDGEAVSGKTAVLSDGNNWTYTFKDLDILNASGSEAVYTVKETAADPASGYTTSYEGKVDVLVTARNQNEGTELITAALKDASGNVLATAELNKDNGWSATKTVDFYDSQGSPKGQILVEEVVGEEETSSGANFTVNILNRRVSVVNTETTDITATKVWDDNNNQDGTRPDSVWLTLTGTVTVVDTETNEQTSKQVYTDTQLVKADTEWAHTWTALDAYANGQPVSYTVDEADVTGYTKDVGTITGDIESGYCVTITNTHTPETVNISGTKVWEDNENQDGKRPASVTIRLLANGTAVEEKTAVVTANTAWAWSFENLPKYANGAEISYTVTEEAVTDYSTAIEKAKDEDGTEIPNQYVVTNSYTPAETSVTVSKSWADENNQDGIRPESVQVQLKANEVDSGGPITLNAGNQWTYTWQNLPVNADGTAITYTVEEVKTEVITGTDGSGTYASSVTGNATKGFTITNTHTPATTSIAVSKSWKDGNNQDGIRPESVQVKLKANGADSGNPITLNAGNQWTYTWQNLPVNANGTAITYTVEEVKTEIITGTDGAGTYADSVSGDATAGFVITNTHTPETTTISGQKIWNDDAYRVLEGYQLPESITVTLYADGTATEKTATVTAAGDWKFEFTDLPKYRDQGTEIKYTVQEKDVPGYTGAITVSGDSSITVTNTPNQEESINPTSITLRKVDADTNDEISTAAKFKLKDPEGDEQEISVVGNTQITFNKEGTYTLTETQAPEGYSFETAPSYTISVAKNFVKVQLNSEKSVWTWLYNLVAGSTADYKDGVLTVKNTPEKVTISGTKTWYDGDNANRPKNITVALYADGTATDKTATVTSDASGEWKYEFKDLPKYKIEAGKVGSEIKYTVQEEPVSGYQTIQREGSADITNVLLKDITVTKAWNDFNNKYSLRPEKITVNLKSGETVVQTASVAPDEDGNWSYTFTNIPAYDKNGEILYTVTEETVDGYVSNVSGSAKSGFIITNSLKTGDLVINKDLTDFKQMPDASKTVTFIFHVTAKMSGSEKTVFEDYVALNFDGKGSKQVIIKGKIPVGAIATVEEVYSGAGYTLDDQIPVTQEVTITDPDAQAEGDTPATATVSFTNKFNNQTTGGYGVVNKYTNGGSWNVNNDGDNQGIYGGNLPPGPARDPN